MSAPCPVLWWLHGGLGVVVVIVIIARHFPLSLRVRIPSVRCVACEREYTGACDVFPHAASPWEVGPTVGTGSPRVTAVATTGRVHGVYPESTRAALTPPLTPRSAKRGHHASTRPAARRGSSARGEEGAIAIAWWPGPRVPLAPSTAQHSRRI